MRLAIVHYHLRKGGVTRVIASALEALGDSVEAVVLSSTPAGEPLSCPVRVIPELAYQREFSEGAAEDLHKRMLHEAEAALGGEPDIWHIHNHSLGKNVHFPRALQLLAKDGHRLLLQIHDFAEDGRPGLYADQLKACPELERILYPVAGQIAYAVLNGRDRDILSTGSIPPGQIHWLPNAVTAPPVHEPGPEGGRATSDAPLILYPTRAIRRKNLGELLLLSATSPEYRFATTLSPKNPQWAAVYSHWVALGAELDLPVAFGLGEEPGRTFEGLIHESAAMVTTSVGEGFGLAFLEPWLMGRPVAGRDLPEITSDFKANGIRLPDLYAEWRIPLDLFDHSALKARYGAKVREVYAAYARKASSPSIERAWKRLTGDGCMDFGCMDEPAQAECLRNICSGKAKVPSLLDLSCMDRDPCAANAGLILELYGLDQYRKKLLGIYGKLMEADRTGPGHAEAGHILDAFLEPERIRLLRT